MSKYILAIDQGTTSTRAILFDRAGAVVGMTQKELTLEYPANGWVEQNPEDIWQDTRYVCRGVVSQFAANATEIACIGITNQRETTIVWDRETGEAVAPAIVWQDRRTAAFCEELRAAGHAETFQQKTGLLIDPYFSGTKLRWILDNVPGAREKAEAGRLAFGTVDCFLLWRLTGGAVHATDATNASRTLMFNVVTQDWDDALLAILGVPRAMLPAVHDNAHHYGDVTKDFLGAAIPVTGMAGDQQAALIGQACFAPGHVKSTYGTGCFALMNIGRDFRVSRNRLLTTVAYRLNGEVSYAVEGSIFVAGAAVQWLRDGLGVIKSAAETEAVVQSVPDNNGVYLVPAFTGLGAPYWRPDARGLITGLTRGATAAHIVRAGLEAQAYQTQDLMAAMADDAGRDIAEIRVDGGMVANDWICQFIADVTRRTVLRPQVVETTALGAAYLAGLQADIFASCDEIAAAWRQQKAFAPVMPAPAAEGLYDGWKKAVAQALAI